MVKLYEEKRQKDLGKNLGEQKHSESYQQRGNWEGPLKMNERARVWWHTPIIPASQEVDTGGL
jgi:hypothetical protein